MNLSFSGGYLSWFQTLHPRERRLCVVVAIILGSCVYFNGFVKGQLRRMAQLKKEYAENQKRYQLVIADFPKLDEARGELETIQHAIEGMRQQVATIESQLLSLQQIPQVLTALVKYAQGLSIDLQSMKQKTQQDKSGLSRFTVDMRFDAGYENAANYVRELEGMSPLIKLQEIQITPSKRDPRNLVDVSLQLTAIMTDAASPREELFLSHREDNKTLTIPRNPLMPRFGVSDQNENKTLQVTGITYRSQGISTAIINDTVVKVGDEIKGYKIESILADSVVIKEGEQRQELKVER